MTSGRGFTLIEVLIAVVVVAILASIALPTYQDSVRRARRADATTHLESLAQQLERCRAQFGRYNAAACTIASPQDSPEGYYRVEISRDSASFRLLATAQGAQSTDSRCSSFSLNQLGERSATGSDTERCW